MTVAELIEKLKEFPEDLPVAHEVDGYQMVVVDADFSRDLLFGNPEGRNARTQTFVRLI